MTAQNESFWAVFILLKTFRLLATDFFACLL